MSGFYFLSSTMLVLVSDDVPVSFLSSTSPIHGVFFHCHCHLDVNSHGYCVDVVRINKLARLL